MIAENVVYVLEMSFAKRQAWLNEKFDFFLIDCFISAWTSAGKSTYKLANATLGSKELKQRDKQDPNNIFILR